MASRAAVLDCMHFLLVIPRSIDAARGFFGKVACNVGAGRRRVNTRCSGCEEAERLEPVDSERRLFNFQRAKEALTEAVAVADRLRSEEPDSVTAQD